MEKRRYNKGFHISFNKKRATTKSDNIAKQKTTELALAETIETKPKFDATSELQESKPNKIETFEQEEEAVTTSVQTAEKEVVQSINHAQRDRKIETKKSKKIKKKRSEKLNKKKHEQKSSNIASSTTPKNGINGLWYFSFLGLLPLLMAAKNQGYKVSSWAAQNPTKARNAIGSLYLLGFGSSFALGNIIHPTMQTWMLIVPSMFALGILSADALGHTKGLNFTQKRMTYATMNIASFFGTFALGAQSNFQLLSDPGSGVEQNGTMTGLIVTGIMIGMALAIALIAYLACALACSSSGAAALLVAGLGWPSVFFFGIWGILTVLGGKSRRSDNLRHAFFVALAVLVTLLMIVAIVALL